MCVSFTIIRYDIVNVLGVMCNASSHVVSSGVGKGSFADITHDVIPCNIIS